MKKENDNKSIYNLIKGSSKSSISTNSSNSAISRAIEIETGKKINKIRPIILDI